MKHPKPEEWADYVRGIFNPERASALEKHLGEGCQECDRQVEALKAVCRLVETSLTFEPPEKAVRAVKSLFRVQNLLETQERADRELALNFDSFLSPAHAGVRGHDVSDRHLVFRSSALFLDLQLEGADEGKPLTIRGQLLDGDSNPLAEVPTFLLEGGRISSQDLSGAVGDFSLLADAERASRLCLLLDDELVDVPLPSLSARPPLARTH